MCRNLQSDTFKRPRLVWQEKCEHTHSGVSLGNTTTHTTQQASGSRVDTHRDSSGLNLRSRKQQHRTLCGCLNPCLRRMSTLITEPKSREVTDPRNETLVKPGETTSTPNGLDGLEHGLGTVRSHLSLEDL